jgi:hypothetical protein
MGSASEDSLTVPPPRRIPSPSTSTLLSTIPAPSCAEGRGTRAGQRRSRPPSRGCAHRSMRMPSDSDQCNHETTRAKNRHRRIQPTCCLHECSASVLWLYRGVFRLASSRESYRIPRTTLSHGNVRMLGVPRTASAFVPQ